MTLCLYNTLSGSKEQFVPHDSAHVTMYVCGPTVYDRPHLGNVRPVVVFDVLFRLLQRLYPRVSYVRNITDVDDKIEAAARQNGISISELTDRNISQFHEDLRCLNALAPTYEPRATHHISAMIDMIQKLVDQGYAYTTHGHVLFSIEKFKAYGALSKQSLQEMCAGARVDVAHYKACAGDFVLWKPSSIEHGQIGWQSPWGYGRPGWHVECSAMCNQYLGKTFDIHGGGIDLAFPHHENEIAQSCAANQTPYLARIWMHNGHLTHGGEKMSKSLGNVVSVQDLNQTLSGEVLRIALLSVHYRQPHHWTQQHIVQARQLQNQLQPILQNHPPTVGPCQEIEQALKSDLNVPLALCKLYGYIKEKRYQEVSHASWLLGFRPLTTKPKSNKAHRTLSPELASLLKKRIQARAQKKWDESDRLRHALKQHGIHVQDQPNGTIWSWIDE